ncbi:MAG: PilN domain-containing protein [bacterium]
MPKNFVNLLTKKTQGEMKDARNIEFSSIYSAFLPILACVVWIGLVVANGAVANNVKIEKVNIETQKTMENDMTVFKKNNGQLVKKIDILKPIIERDVDPNKVFDQIRKNLSTYSEILSIDGYTRKSDGQFSFSGKSRTYLELSRVIKKFEENAELKNVNLKSISYNKESDVVSFAVTFYYVTL